MQILTGGCWGRPLKQSGPGNTASAWQASPTGVLHLRPCAIVPDPGETPHPSGWATRDAFAVDAFVPVYLYAEAIATGKTAIQAADDRVQALLHQWQVTADGDRWSVLATGDRVGVTDSSDYPGTISTMRRYRATAARLIQEVA